MMSGTMKSGLGGAFVLGAIAGAVAALLLAPRNGKDTRAQVYSAKDNLGGQTDRLKGALDAGKGKAADQSNVLKRKIEETRARLKHQMDVTDDQASDATADTVSDAVADEAPGDLSVPV
jgi:gas vesicle protein